MEADPNDGIPKIPKTSSSLASDMVASGSRSAPAAPLAPAQALAPSSSSSTIPQAVVPAHNNVLPDALAIQEIIIPIENAVPQLPIELINENQLVIPEEPLELMPIDNQDLTREIFNFRILSHIGEPTGHEEDLLNRQIIHGEKHEGELHFIGTKAEVDIEMADIVPPVSPMASVPIEVALLLDQLVKRVDSLEAGEKETKHELVRLQQMEREHHQIKLEIQEKIDDCKIIGQYRQRVKTLTIQLVLASSDDLNGFKILVGDTFGYDFEDTKKKARENYENFPEKERLWELMAYCCHCRMLEETPGYVHGAPLPSYPTNNEMGESSELASVGPKRKKGPKPVMTPLRERTKALQMSYARVYTNFYHDDKKGEERKELKRLREKERRAKKKFEQDQAKKGKLHHDQPEQASIEDANNGTVAA